MNRAEMFMAESHSIEGELGTREGIFICEEIIKNNFSIDNLDDILFLHKQVSKHSLGDRSGKWRTHNVRVGNWHAPDWTEVPELMDQFMNDWNKMNSWEAHNRFESIHPFEDFNGRIGRLIWLAKAIMEDYDFQRSFLHHYYYQTLRYANL